MATFPGKQTDRQTDNQIDKQIDRQTRQTDRQTDRQERKVDHELGGCLVAEVQVHGVALHAEMAVPLGPVDLWGFAL